MFSINFHVSQYTDLLKRNIDILDVDFDKIYFLSGRDKLAQVYSLAKGTLTDQWAVASKVSDEFDCAQVRKSLVIKALLDITASEEYFEENLKMYCDREVVYEEFQNFQNTEVFQTVFLDCNLESEFHRETFLKKQTNANDQTAINNLKQYLGMGRSQHCK